MDRKTLLIVMTVLLFALFGIMIFIDNAMGAKIVQSLPGEGFTYQGQLIQNSRVVDGACDFRFSLWTDSSGGSQVGENQHVKDVSVSGGYFTIPSLDFGGGAFNGEARWLEIETMCAGDAGFTKLSPRQPVTPAPYALALPGLYTRQNETSPNVIAGYPGNIVNDGVFGAAIGGGGSAVSQNRVTDQYGTVAGGSGNQTGNQDESPDNALYAAVGGGKNNLASGMGAFVGGGENNSAVDTYAMVSGGQANTADGDYASIPGGYQAETRLFGQTAYASGAFSKTGDAQYSTYTLRNITTDAAITELFLEGASARLTIPADRTIAFEIIMAARRNAFVQSAGYLFRGVIKNDAGMTSFIPSPTKTVLGEDNPAWDVNIIANDAYDALIIQVSGAENATIRWVATVRTIEVAW